MATYTVAEAWNSVKDGVLEYLRDKDVLSVIAHGSYAEGFANRNSDFDLLVICGENMEEKEDVIVVNDLDINFNYYREKTLLSQLESLEEMIAPNRVGFSIPLFCRLKNAVVLVDKEGVGETIVNLARQYKPSFNLITLYSKAGLNYYYDAVGAMISGDYATSVHMARIGALLVLTGIILNEGELFIKNKWAIHLTEKIPSFSTDVFLELMGLDHSDKKQAQQCVRNLNRLITEFQYLREKAGDSSL